MNSNSPVESPRLIDIQTLKDLGDIQEEVLMGIMTLIKEKHMYESLSVIKNKINWNFDLICKLLIYVNNNNINYKIITSLKNYLPHLTIDQLISIINLFSDEKYKYKICTKLGSHTDYLFNDNTKLLISFDDTKFKNEVIKFSNILKRDITYKDIIKIISDYPSDSSSKLDLLERSIKFSGVKLGDTNEYCQQLRDIFDHEDYIKACEILGINPDVFELFI